MKFSTFSLFLLLLFVLALVIVVGNWFQTEYGSSNSNPFVSIFDSSPSEYFSGKTTEGLISYYGDVSYGSIKVSNYTMTRNVHKLYDCIYYDPSNGAVILLDGNTYTSGNVYDYSGNTISRITCVERDGKIGNPINYLYSVSGDYQSDISKKPMKDFYNSFTVTSNVTSSGSGKVDKYELIYVSWGKETYLHLIVLNDATTSDNNNTLKLTYVYDNAGNRVQTVNKDSYSNESNVAIHNVKLATTNPGSHDQYDGTLQPVLGYDTGNTKFQLCKNNYYDVLNGDIIQYDSSNRNKSDIKIYSRVVNKNNDVSLNTYYYKDNQYSPSLPTPTDNVPNVSSGFRAVSINGSIFATDSYYSTLYISIGQRTVLTILNPSKMGGDFEIHKVFRVKDKKIDDGTINGSTIVGSSTGSGRTDKKPGDKDKDMDDLLYQYILKTMLGGYDGATINDYMLKTQIVPPVCPTCPSCPSSGVCNNCGGNGGSGTSVGGGVVGVANNAVTGTVGVAKDVVGGTVGLARDTVGGTIGLARDTVGGTVGLAKDTVGGTVGLARETVGGTVGLVKDAVGGTVGLTKDVVGGVANTVGKLSPTEVSNDGSSSNSNTSSNSANTVYSAGGGKGTSITAGSDPSSYFGALPPKGSNFIPVTADFSRFGR